jgi:hypothetical protein
MSLRVTRSGLAWVPKWHRLRLAANKFSRFIRRLFLKGQLIHSAPYVVTCFHLHMLKTGTHCSTCCKNSWSWIGGDQFVSLCRPAVPIASFRILRHCRDIMVQWLALVLRIGGLWHPISAPRPGFVVILFIHHLFTCFIYPVGTRVSSPMGKAAGAWTWPLTSI